MASIEPCEKHEIINCSVCHKPPEPVRVKGGRGDRTSPPVEARYPGFCYECREPIEVGDVIRRSDDDEGWICEDCAR